MTRVRMESAIACAVVVALGAGGAWWWHRTVAATQSLGLPEELWEQVKEAHPMREPSADIIPLSPQMVDAVIKANPFSPKRREVPPQTADRATDTPESASQPPSPKFTYKGRILVGSRQRAIVEDVVNHKTHFLEVGQEVTGFKVLDMAENRVVLLDPQSREEMVLTLTAARATPSTPGSGEKPRR